MIIVFQLIEMKKKKKNGKIDKIVLGYFAVSLKIIRSFVAEWNKQSVFFKPFMILIQIYHALKDNGKEEYNKLINLENNAKCLLSWLIIFIYIDLG